MSELRYEKEDLEAALAVLRSGGVILSGTDTVWGFACDASNPEALRKLGEIKGRTEGPFIILVENDARLNKHVNEVPAVAWDIIDLSDKPVTLIFPGAGNLAEKVIAEDGSVGVRIVKEPFIRDLVRKLNKPLASTSANFNDRPAPMTFDQIDPEILKKADYVAEFRRNDKRTVKPSSIIKLGMGGEVKVIRP